MSEVMISGVMVVVAAQAPVSASSVLSSYRSLSLTRFLTFVFCVIGILVYTIWCPNLVV